MIHRRAPTDAVDRAHDTYVRETGECMMNAATTGLAAGMALGFAGY